MVEACLSLPESVDSWKTENVLKRFLLVWEKDTVKVERERQVDRAEMKLPLERRVERAEMKLPLERQDNVDSVSCLR